MVASQQCAACGIVGGDIGLQGYDVAQCRHDPRVGEGGGLHFFAAHAPGGVIIEQYRLASRLGRSQCLIQLGDRMYRLKSNPDDSRIIGSAGEYAQWPQQGC